MHTLGQLLHDHEKIERFLAERRDAGVELRDFTHFSDQGDQTRARLLGFVHHLAMTIVQRRRVALEHAKVTADDARRRPELMNGEREEFGTGVFRHS